MRPIARNQVDFRFTRLPAFSVPSAVFSTVRNQVDADLTAIGRIGNAVHRQAHAVHRDRPFVAR